jgi:hypothetical protein
MVSRRSSVIAVTTPSTSESGRRSFRYIGRKSDYGGFDNDTLRDDPSFAALHAGEPAGRIRMGGGISFMAVKPLWRRPPGSQRTLEDKDDEIPDSASCADGRKEGNSHDPARE